MRPYKKQLFIVSHGSYKFDVMVSVGYSHAEILKAVLKRTDLSDEEKDALHRTGQGRTTVLQGGQTVLQLPICPRPAFQACLAHEVFHAVEFLFNRVGIVHDIDKSGEAYAYQIGHLTEQIYAKLK